MHPDSADAKQDAIILNIQRACAAAIDLAMHLVRRHRLGIPQDSREVFDLLGANSLAVIAGHLTDLVDFSVHAVRNFARDAGERTEDGGE